MAQDRAHFEFVLSALRHALDMPQLQPDADGICQITFDGRFIVNVGWREPHVVWFAPVGALGTSGRSQALSALLQANLFWRETGGATLALSTDGETVILAYQAPMAGLSQADIGNLLRWFAGQTDHWVTHLAALQHAGDRSDHAHEARGHESAWWQGAQGGYFHGR